jgi:hypothetical protein
MYLANLNVQNIEFHYFASNVNAVFVQNVDRYGLLHYETFVFIIICYLASSLAIFHAYRGEKISIQHIEKKQELCNIV